MLRYTTDPIPFTEFAKQNNYDTLNPDDPEQKRLRDELRDHYLNFNVQNIAAQSGEKFTDVKRDVGLALDQYDTTLRERRLAVLNTDPLGRQNQPATTIQFDPEQDSTFQQYSKAVGEGFAVGLSESISGLGLIGNTIARQFNPNSEFGLDLTDFGQKLTNDFRQYFTIDGEEAFGTDVARGVGQFVSLFVGGGAGGLAARGGARLLTKGALKASTSNFVSSIGSATGLLTTGAGPQVTEMVDRYIDELPDNAQVDQETLNTLVASGVLLSGIDAIVPGRILGDSALFKAVADRAISNRVFRAASSVAGRATETALLEGATEGLQAIAADIIAEAVIKDATFEESFEAALDDLANTGREAATGAGTGFIVGLLSTLVPGRGVISDPQDTSVPNINDPTPESTPQEGGPAQTQPDQLIGQTYEYQGRQYVVLEDTLNQDGTQGDLIAQTTLDNGLTQEFNIDSTDARNSSFIQDYLGKRQQRTEDNTGNIGQGQVFAYEANPGASDQSVPLTTSDVTQQVNTADNDGDPGSASRTFTLNEDSLRPVRFRDRVKRAAARQFASGGELKDHQAKSQFIQKAYQDSNQEGVVRAAELYNAGVRLADVEIREPIFNFQTALRSEFKNVSNADINVLDQAASGNIKALNTLPPKTAQAIVDIRNQINSNSAQISAELQLIVDQLTTRLQNQQTRLQPQHPDVVATRLNLNSLQQQLQAVNNNLPNDDNPLGSYVHRSYAIFVDSKYREKVFNPQNQEYKDFLTYVASEHIRRNPNLTDSQAQAQAQSDIQRLEDTVNGLRDAPNLTNDQAILNSISALRRRQNLPPEVRSFLGQIRDPAINYAATIHQQRIILSSIEMANNLRDKGLEQGWLSEEPNSNNGAIVPFRSSNNNPGVMMLNGYYAPDYIVNGLNDYFQVGNIDNVVLKHLQSILSMVKIGKTIGSVGTQVRNLLSSLWVMGVNGTVTNPRHVATSVATIKRELSGKKATDYHKMLVKNGVISDGIAVGTIRQITNDVGFLDQYGLFDQNVSTKALTNGPGPLRRLTRGAIKAYQASDDFPKVVGFEHYRDLFARADGLDRNDPRVIEKAAIRVRDTFFTYSKVARIIQQARSVPFAPPFISFPAEVYRTSKNFLRFVKEDLQSGNPVLQRNASFRLISATATAGLTYNLGQILGELVGSEDEEIADQERTLMEEFLKHGKYTEGNDLQVMRKLNDGRYEVVNMTRYNPYAGVSDVVGNFINGDADLDKKLWDAVRGLAQPFYQPDVTFSAIDKAIEKYEQAPGSDAAKTAVFLKELGKNVAPTTVTEAYRVYLATQGELLNNDESKVSVGRATARALGATTDVIDPLLVLQFKARALQDQIKLTNDSARFSIVGRNASEIDAIAFNQQLGLVNREWARVSRAISILKQLGYDTSVGSNVYRSLISGKKGAGGPLKKDFANLLINGDPYPGVDIPEQAISNKERRTLFFQGQDAAEEAAKLAREKFDRLAR